MSREALLKLLCKGAGYWRESSTGYGASASVVELAEDGLYACGIETGPLTEGPFVLAQEAIAAVEQGREPSTGGLDSAEIRAFLAAGAKPGVEYWLITSELRAASGEIDLFTSEEAASDAANGLVDWARELVGEWGEMDGQELREWAEIALLIERGFTSVYELPDHDDLD